MVWHKTQPEKIAWTYIRKHGHIFSRAWFQNLCDEQQTTVTNFNDCGFELKWKACDILFVKPCSFNSYLDRYIREMNQHFIQNLFLFNWVRICKLIGTLSNPFLEPTSNECKVSCLRKQQLFPDRIWTHTAGDPYITRLTC